MPGKIAIINYNKCAPEECKDVIGKAANASIKKTD